MKNNVQCFALKILPATVMLSVATTAQSQLLLEEIVVTAQKREQVVTDIPMAITAISGDDLKALGLTDTRDLAQLVPGLSFSVSRQQTPVYTMRGIGFNTFNFTSTSPVGVYYDEFAAPYPYMAKGLSFDVNRLEVLKGPQGTLYGRNTTGGLVNYLSNQPGEEFEAEISVGLGNFETTTAEGFVSGAVTDTFGLRAAFSYENAGEGWQKSVTRPGDKLGEKDRYGVRLIADFQPTEDFSATLTVSHWKDESDSVARQAIAAQDFPPGFALGNLPGDQFSVFDFVVPEGNAELADWYDPSAASPGADAWPAPFAPLPELDNESDSTQVNLRLDWQINDSVTVSSLTHSGTTERRDLNNQGGNSTEYGLTQSTGEIDTFSQELRLSGVSANERLNYIVGLYYSKDDLFENDNIWSATSGQIRQQRAIGAQTAMAFGPLLGLDPAGVQALTNAAAGGFRTFSSFTQGESESRAIFGQIDYQINDQLELTLGARYTEDEVNGRGCSRDVQGDGNIHGLWNFLFVSLTAGLGPDQFAQPGECITFLDSTFVDGLVAPDGHAVDLDEDSFSWRAALSWEPVDAAMFYASVSKGFKSGVIPTASSFTANQLQPIKQEEVLAYEIGAKASPTDWMQVNASIYHYDYEDKQLYGFISDPVFMVLPSFVNVPESEVRGLELDLLMFPTEDTLIKFGASFVDSEITDYNGIGATGAIEDFSGSPFQETPEWEYTLLLSQNFRLANELSLRASVDVSYRDEANAELIAQGVAEPMFNRVGSYTLLGARLTLSPASDDWEVSLFGRNLTDEYYAVFTKVFAFDEYADRVAGMVRTYGAEFTYRF